jgi:hypothetical protein
MKKITAATKPSIAESFRSVTQRNEGSNCRGAVCQTASGQASMKAAAGSPAHADTTCLWIWKESECCRGPGQRWLVYSSQRFSERATGNLWVPKNGLGRAVERLPAAGAEGRFFRHWNRGYGPAAVTDDHAGNARMKGEATQATASRGIWLTASEFSFGTTVLYSTKVRQPARSR